MLVYVGRERGLEHLAMITLYHHFFFYNVDDKVISYFTNKALMEKSLKRSTLMKRKDRI